MEDSRMNPRSRRVAAFAALCTALLLLAAGTASAATLSLPIGTHSVFSGENGTTGILIDFGALDTLVGKRILYAKCFLNVHQDSCTGVFEGLDAMPLVGHSSALATGTFGLPNSSEFAFADAYSTDAEVGLGVGGDTEVLMTELLQAWVDGGMPKNGLF